MSVYACSDLHGMGELWDQIKAFLQPEDTLYFLGDAADRGPSGWRIIKEMLDDKRVLYLRGNHDTMLIERFYQKHYDSDELHRMNGGDVTWEACRHDPQKQDYIAKLENTAHYAIYTNTDGAQIFMSHSGSTNVEDEEELEWNRSEWAQYSTNIIVHGHTTIPHLIRRIQQLNQTLEDGSKIVCPEWESGAYWYNGARVDIDCQSVRTGQTVLLDLDTFDEHIFECEVDD